MRPLHANPKILPGIDWCLQSGAQRARRGQLPTPNRANSPYPPPRGARLDCRAPCRRRLLSLSSRCEGQASNTVFPTGAGVEGGARLARPSSLTGICHLGEARTLPYSVVVTTGKGIPAGARRWRGSVAATRSKAALALATVVGMSVLAASHGSTLDAAGADAPLQRTCKAQARHIVAPDTLALNGRATVTLTLSTDCSTIQVPTHVSLVFDNSVAMGGVRMSYMKQAVAAFTEAMDFTVARVGLVRFSQSADILAPLTADPVEINTAAQQFFPRVGSNLTMGIRAGRFALEQGRDLAVIPDPEEVMILLVGSSNDEGPEEALAEAQLAKDAGITLIVVAAGVDADPVTLEQMATSSSLFYSEGTGSRWPSLFTNLAQSQGSVNVTGGSVTDTLPASLAYVFGSGFPAPRLRGQELGWQFGIWPAEGITIEFQVEAKVLGRLPLSENAFADLTLDRGLPQHVVFPIPEIDVVPGPSATPPPVTATAVPTGTPHLRRAFLPIASMGECLANHGPAEVVVVIDTSASTMTAFERGVRLDRELAASARLLDSLRFPADTGGVIAVAGDAHVLKAPTSNRGALITALGGIYNRVAPASRLQRGIDVASTLPRDPGRRRIIVAITDGVDDPAMVRTAVEAARRSDAQILGVGFGPDVTAAQMQAMFAPRTWEWSASATGLSEAIGRVERAVRCSAGLRGGPLAESSTRFAGESH